MEPISAITATAQIATAAQTSARTTSTALRFAWRRLRLFGTYDAKWLDFGLTSHSSVTADQASDIQSFLSSRRVAPLLIVHTLEHLAGRAGDDSELATTIRDAFINEARRWNADSDSNWASVINELWQSVQFFYVDALPRMARTDEIADEIEQFENFLASPFKLGTPRSTKRDFLRRLTSLTSDIERLAGTQETLASIANLIDAARDEPIINHADVDHSFEFSELYVERTLVDELTNETLTADTLLRSGRPFRVVLTGPPGAGKSTLVKHLTSISSRGDQDVTQPVLIVRCRDYVRQGWLVSISSYLAEATSAHLSTTIEPAALEDAFLIGSTTIVFDGLDEVTDPNQRAHMVQRIHAFTAQYPALSVLVTSREVGYERSPLSSTIFKHVHLQEFSLEQTETYCTNWFRLSRRPELVPPFMRESESVQDLRVNPLLLSLLCILYRDSGAIPTNRRDIYSQCATLLFHRWDAQRSIAQHPLMPQYGDRIMQEIARWFYTTPSTQHGLEEQLISKAITGYMVQSLGMQHEIAETSARDFLMFCADRAWLLGAVGTNGYGQRIFRFTHRTFYEYFAAEAIVRRTESAGELAQTILAAHSADSTSVAPELMIQSYDFRQERGGAKLFTALCELKSPAVLLLRLMEGAILPDYARKMGFDLIFEQTDNRTLHGPFYRRHELPPETSSAILTMTAMPRAHFIKAYLEDPTRADIRETFLVAWATSQLSGRNDRHLSVWQGAIDRIMDTFPKEVQRSQHPSIINWRAVMGSESPVLSSVNYFATRTPAGLVPGAVWWSAIVGSLPDSVFAPASRENEFLATMHHRFTSSEQFPLRAVIALRDAVTGLEVEDQAWIAEGKILHPTGSDLIGLLILAMFEATAPEDRLTGALAESLEHLWPGSIRCIPLVRAWRLGDAKKPSEETGQLGMIALRALPERARMWARGESDLCLPPSPGSAERSRRGVRWRQHEREQS